jgi:hypothetical protein
MLMNHKYELDAANALLLCLNHESVQKTPMVMIVLLLVEDVSWPQLFVNVVVHVDD